MDSDGGWLALDYETNCLKPEYPDARIVSCAFANEHGVISYPWSPVAADATSRALRSKRTRKVASNLKFEERWTRKHLGHGVTNWGWDTMLAAHCLDNRPDICSIKFQALVKLGVPAYNKSIEPYLLSRSGPYNRIAEVELSRLLFYGGQDAWLELLVAQMQRKELCSG
jgi:hypothetical protein